MPGNLQKALNLISNMGWRYTRFRVQRLVLQKTGFFKSRFPAKPAHKTYLNINDWRQTPVHFFFKDRESLNFPKKLTPELTQQFNELKSGNFLLFNSLYKNLGMNYDWLTNPDSGFKYDVNKHWTEIPDYSTAAGDIKFVWEKSRFSYLYDIIRYDYHSGIDCSEMVIHDILSWITANPVNCGPNYRCSQEMSLRILNWTFALHYYKNSPNLDYKVFDQIQYAIYCHLDHIYNNIDFSRIAVRNNHAITETLTLYLGGLLYPALPGAAKWKQKGKQWFEEEIAYQVYDDGTFLQFSMNYHRIVVQLMTWAIALSEKNEEKFSSVVYDRAAKSVAFLRTCMNDANGWLPNYGANDGALFFKLNDAHYRDYRPALQALAGALQKNTEFNNSNEDSYWYNIQLIETNTVNQKNGVFQFDKGGYYVIREPDTLTFIKCGGYKDRPSHADNLHIDIWHNGENALLDAGSYKYNTDKDTMRYFSGTASHNTVMLNDLDQMLKGGHFIWFYWSRFIEAELAETTDEYIFTGKVSVYRYINKNITHKRTITKIKGKAEWTITDELTGIPAGISLKQLWHIPKEPPQNTSIRATNISEASLQQEITEGWYSGLYGQKIPTKTIYFNSKEPVIKTILTITD